MANVFTLFGTLHMNTAQFTTALGGAQTMLTQTRVKIDALESGMHRMGASASKMGHLLSLGLTLPIMGIGVAATKMAETFQQKMVYIRTQAGDTTDSIAQLSKEVLDLARVSQFGPETLADGLYHLASLGLRGAEAMNALATSAKMASLGGAHLEETTSALGAAVITGIKGIEDLNMAAGVLDATIGAGNMRMDELVASLGTGVLPVFKLAGLGILDYGAALSTMTDNGMSAVASANRLRMTIALMQAPSENAKKFLQGIGLAASDLGMSMMNSGLIPTLELLKRKLTETYGTTAEGRQKISMTLTEVFGGGRSSGAIQLLLDQLDRVKQKYHQIEEQGGEFADKVREQSETAAARMKTAWSSIQVDLIELGGVILPYVATAIQKLAEGVRIAGEWFKGLDPVAQKLMVVFAGVAAAAGPLLIILGQVAMGISAIISVAGAISGVVAAMGGLGPVLAIIAGVVAGIGVLAAEIYVLKQAWDSNFGGIREFTIEVFDSVQKTISETIRVIREYWDSHGKAIVASVSYAWKLISDVYKTNFGIISDLIKFVLDVIRGRWSDAWQDLLNAAKGFGKSIVQQTRAMIEGLKAFFMDFLPWIAKWGAKLVVESNIMAAAFVVKFMYHLQMLPIYIIRLVPKMIAAGAQLAKAVWDGMREGFQDAASATGSMDIPGVENITAGLGGVALDGVKDLKNLTEDIDKVGNSAGNTGGKIDKMSNSLKKAIDTTKQWTSEDMAKWALALGYETHKGQGRATGGHNKDSLHYQGRALDIGLGSNPELRDVRTYVKLLADAIKAGLRVVDERVRPKPGAVWTGPHAHLEENDKRASFFNEKLDYGGALEYLKSLDALRRSGKASKDPLSEVASVQKEALEALNKQIDKLTDSWKEWQSSIQPVKTNQEEVNDLLKDPKVTQAMVDRVNALNKESKLTPGLAADWMKIAAYIKDASNIEFDPKVFGDGSGRSLTEEVGSITKDPESPLNEGYPPKITAPWTRFWDTFHEKMQVAKDALPSFKQAIGDNLVNVLYGLGDALATNLTAWANRTKTFAQAMKDTFRSLISDLIQQLIRLMIYKLIFSLLGSIAGGSSGVGSHSGGSGGLGGLAGMGDLDPGFALGGFTGFGPSDAIAGVVHKNEFVLPANVVSQAGLANLEHLRRTGSMPSSGGHSNKTVVNKVNININGGNTSPQTIDQIQRAVLKALHETERRNK